MKSSHLLLLLLLIFSNTLFAYTWSPYGPPDVPISKVDWHIPAILSNGDIGILESHVWNYYSYSNLNVIDFTSFNDSTLMVILGSGSNSDGVYLFNLHTHAFQLLDWTMNPNFIKYCSYDSMFYLGGLQGLVKTENGSNWAPVNIPGTGSVTDFAYQGNHFVASKNGETWYSSDGGINWNQSPFGSLRHHFRFDDDGDLYAIMNAGTYSDGIWISNDYGNTWNVIIWTLHLSCIGPRYNGSLPFGYMNGVASAVGVGMTIPGGDYILINDGLTNLNVNCMEMFDLINTPSFWVGTDQGAFFCTGFITPNYDQLAPSPSNKLTSFPNPFSSYTTINFAKFNGDNKRIEIYNIRGERVYTSNTTHLNNTIWYGENTQGKKVGNGVYLCKLVSNGKTLATKSIILLR